MPLKQVGRHNRRVIIAMPHLEIGWRVRVSTVDGNNRRPCWIIGRRACSDVQLDGLKVSWISRLNTDCYCPDHFVIGRGFPGVEIIAVQPDEVVEMVVTVTKISTIGGGSVWTIVAERRDPLTGFDGVKEQDETTVSRERKHLVDTGKICFVRFSEIIMGGVSPAGN